MAKYFVIRGTTVVIACILYACRVHILYQPVTPASAVYNMYHMGTMSTKIQGGADSVGTALKIDMEVEVKQVKGGWTWRRKPKDFLAKGWNKDLIDDELENLVPLEVTLDSLGNPVQFSGYDSINEILGAIPKTEKMRKRLLASIDTSFYKNQWADRWKLFHILEPGTFEQGQRLETAALNDELKTLKVDSVVIMGPRMLGQRKCLEYSVNYTKQRPVRLEIEQLFASFENFLARHQIGISLFFETSPDFGKILKKGTGEKENIRGRWRFSVHLQNGLPCYESRTESCDLTIEGPVTKNKVPVTLYRFSENVFKYL
jgi:hypothetical protein